LKKCRLKKPRFTPSNRTRFPDLRVAIRFAFVGTKLLKQHRVRVEELDKRKEEALVAVSLCTATLIACFSIAFALL
jgi:hypothetical protein